MNDGLITLPSSNCSLSCKAYPRPHDNPATDLTADADRIQGRPDIVRGSDLSYFDHSGLIIELDLYRLSPVFPARYVFFSMDFVRQRRIVAFTTIPSPAQDRFFSIVSLLQNFSKRERNFWVTLRYDPLIFNQQITFGNFRHLRCHL